MLVEVLNTRPEVHNTVRRVPSTRQPRPATRRPHHQANLPAIIIHHQAPRTVRIQVATARRQPPNILQLLPQLTHHHRQGTAPQALPTARLDRPIRRPVHQARPTMRKMMIKWEIKVICVDFSLSILIFNGFLKHFKFKQMTHKDFVY